MKFQDREVEIISKKSVFGKIIDEIKIVSLHYQSLCLTESEALRNRQHLLAANRYKII